MKPAKVSSAIYELINTGLLERTQEHVRPGAGHKPLCAEYRLPHRQKGSYRPNEKQKLTGPYAVLDRGDRVRQGYVKLMAGDLMKILVELSDAELEVLWIIAFRNHPRTHGGAIFGEPVITAMRSAH